MGGVRQRTLLLRTFLLVPVMNFAMAGCVSATKGDAHEPAPEILTRFYRAYFEKRDGFPSSATRPEPAFSEDFLDLRRENDEVCREIADPGEVCGFGTAFDPFLDAQDAGPKLTLESARFAAREISPGVVEVEFDLLPPERSHYHHRRLRYLMKIENDRWVVDDIVYADRSAKATMMSEIRDLRRTIF